jgi:hypothetical protein
MSLLKKQKAEEEKELTPARREQLAAFDKALTAFDEAIQERFREKSDETMRRVEMTREALWEEVRTPLQK